MKQREFNQNMNKNVEELAKEFDRKLNIDYPIKDVLKEMLEDAFVRGYHINREDKTVP